MIPDARCALLLLLAYLAALASVPAGQPIALALLTLVPFALLALSPLPKAETLAQAAYILPLSLAISVVALLRGRTDQAAFFLIRSYASILAVLFATKLLTTLELLRAMERLGVPKFLIIVTEFLLRYLDVLKREADSMRLAALCRGGSHNQLIAASSIAMLFVRSLERSTGIHNAMLARGFNGSLPRWTPMHWTVKDSLYLIAGTALLLTLRLAA
jgi:cobalt/nickel transport system permease protein